MKGMTKAAVKMKAGHAQTDPADMQCVKVMWHSSQDEDVVFLNDNLQDSS